MKLSILTATFNRGDLLQRLYESILENLKTNIDVEWLIMDDGSNDDTEKIISKMRDENKIYIRYLKQVNQGKMAAINHLMDYARGDLIIECDSDDYFAENAFLYLKDAYEESKKSENFQNDILKDIQEIILQMKMLNKGLLGSDIDVESITAKNLDKKIKKAQDKAEKRNEQQDRGEARAKFGRARQKIFGGIKGAVGHTFNRLGGWVFADNTTEDGNVVDRAAYKGVKAAETLGRGVINSPRRAKKAVTKYINLSKVLKDGQEEN